MSEIVNAAVVGVITGVFSAGTIYGVLRTQLLWLRRDVDDIRKHLGWET